MEEFSYYDKKDSFSSLEVSSPHDDWNKSKELKDKQTPFMLSVETETWDGLSYEYVTFDIDTAKELVSFLQDRIDFLEEKPRSKNTDVYKELKRSMNELEDMEEIHVEGFGLEVFFDMKRVYKENGHKSAVKLLEEMVKNDINIRVNTPMNLVGIMKHKLPNNKTVFDLRVKQGDKTHLIKESLLTVID